MGPGISCSPAQHIALLLVLLNPFWRDDQLQHSAQPQCCSQVAAAGVLRPFHLGAASPQALWPYSLPAAAKHQSSNGMVCRQLG